MKIVGDLGIYTNIHDTGELYSTTTKHLYSATCKLCGSEVKLPLYQIRKSKKCHHSKEHSINGYREVYLPDHPAARNNGYVYEHILAAEKMLGRPLSQSEVVHHKDQKRSNNSPGNLMVFATNSDHSRFHKTGIAIQNGDVYVSPPRNNFCVDCGAQIGVRATRCVECERSYRKRNIPLRDELINDLKQKGFTQIGEEYGVSDTAVRKWCRAYGLPFLSSALRDWRITLM